MGAPHPQGKESRDGVVQINVSEDHGLGKRNDTGEKGEQNMSLPTKCDYCSKVLGTSDQVAMIDPVSAERLERNEVLRRPRQRGLAFWKSTVVPPTFQLPQGGKKYVACASCLPPEIAEAALGGSSQTRQRSTRGDATMGDIMKGFATGKYDGEFREFMEQFRPEK